MKYLEEQLKTPLYGEYDVLVVGAGPAGCGAALAAARKGMKTLLIDKFNSLGGMWTIGFMNPLFDYRNKDGILKELVDELHNRNAWGGFWDQSFHYEYMKQILDEKMQEAGVDVLLNTYFSRTLVEDKHVSGGIFENMDGRFAVLSKMLIDCTGDGNAAASAGCAYEIGDGGDYKTCQAMTLMFLVGNIPPAYKDGFMIYEKFDAVYKKAGKEIPFKVPYLIPVPGGNFGVVQFTHIYEHNPLSQRELNEATIEGRRQMIEVIELLKAHDEEFKNLELITSSNILGVRESRRIVGHYTLTLEDVLSGAQFYDGIANVTFGVDIHTMANKGQRCFEVKPYQIPFRCLIPVGFNGILTAGRCISGTQEAMASYRVTGNCCQMGEAAGKVAAECIQKGILPEEVFKEKKE